MATQVSGRFPWSAKAYLSRPAFDADLGRIRRLYQDRGYPNMRLAKVDLAMNASGDGVKITIAIDEEAPTLLNAVQVTGTDALPAGVASSLGKMPPAPGGPRDERTVTAARQRMLDDLLNRGYAYADVQTHEQPAAIAGGVDVTFAVTPGPTGGVRAHHLCGPEADWGGRRAAGIDV